MDIKLKGKLVSDVSLSGGGIISRQHLKFHDGDQAEILVSPLELLEQLTHKQISELLNLINLPQENQEYCKCEEPIKHIHGTCPICRKPLPEKQDKEIEDKVEPIEMRLARIEKYILELLSKPTIIIQKELTQDDWLKIMNRPPIC